MSKRVSGAALSYLLIFVKLVVTLFFTPILVSSLGVDGYGLYALVGALAAYLYILDFGMNDSVMRFFVAHENDTVERDVFLAKMLGLYSLVGALILLGAYAMSLMAEPVFGASNTPEQVEMLSTMILITGIGAAFLVALNPLGALLSATESFIFLRSMEIAATVLSALVMVVVLRAGGGAVQIVMVSTASVITQAVLRLVYAAFVLDARVRIGLPDRKTLTRVARYAAPIFVVMIAETLFWKLDSILIGAVLGAAPVAVYAIGVTFNKYFMSFATALSRVMTPEIIRQIDRGADATMLTDLMIRISRFQAMFLLVILSGLAIFGQRFLVLWLGPEFAPAYWVMLAVLVPYTLELSGNARNIILQVKGLYWQRSAITMVMALLNIPLTLALLQIWGVVGAAISTGIAVFVGYVLIALLLKLRVGMEIGRYWLETARGILPLAVVVTALGLWAERYLPGGWDALLLGGLVHLTVFGLAIYWLAASPDERVFIDRFLRRFRGGKV
ncbi:oligosaccharide flippase family protein [Shimia litoralis]|nr:oligosaccharide flippase family protein [Shimia litoralis]